MWFLLLQIFIFLLIAAALGAALAWWWMKRQYEDVTENHDQMIAQASKLSLLPSKDDLKAALDLEPINERMNRIERAVAAIKFPETDLSPLHERLRSVEARLAAFTLDPVTSQVSNLASAVSRIPAPDLKPLDDRLSRVADAVSRIPPTDLRPLDERLSRIEGAVRAISMPDVDLGPVHSGIATLGLNIEPVQARIGKMETQITELAELLDSARRSDNEAIASRLIALTSSVTSLRMPDVEPLQARLAALETSIAAIKVPDPDFGPLHNRFFQLQNAIGSIQQDVRNRSSFTDIDARLAALQDTLYNLPQPDLSPVLGAVHSIDARLDLEATENRLTAIEYGLAAVHHMLRSRTDPSQRAALADQTRAEIRPAFTEPPRPAAPPPPPPTPHRPTWEADPINTMRRPGDHANLLTEPAFGPADNLETINGVGPMLAALLHEIGVFYFWQVAEWTPEEVGWVESKLQHFRGRIGRDDWVGHARMLATGPTAARRPMAYRGGL